jgi:hypothetical protein
LGWDKCFDVYRNKLAPNNINHLFNDLVQFFRSKGTQPIQNNMTIRREYSIWPHVTWLLQAPQGNELMGRSGDGEIGRRKTEEKEIWRTRGHLKCGVRIAAQ